MKSGEFERLAHAVLENKCSQEEFERFEVGLRESPEFRRIFREIHLIEGMLEIVATEELAEPARPGALAPVNLFMNFHNRRGVTVFLASAVVLLLVVLGALYFRILAPPPVLATLRLAPNSIWTMDRALRGGEGNGLAKGDILSLDAGSLELTFKGGAKAIVKGPAMVEMADRDFMKMKFGSAGIVVPAGVAAVRVATPRIAVVSKGATFGLLASKDSEELPEVHVMQGKAKVEALDGEAGSRELVAGDAVSISLAGKLKSIDMEGDRFLKALLPDLPYIHFTFEPQGDSTLEVTGTEPTAAGTHLTGSPGKPAIVPGIVGMAASFDGSRNALVTDWKGTLGSRARTICAWIRTQPEAPPRRYQSIVGWGDPTIGFAGKCELLLFQPDPGEPTFLRLSFDQFLYTGSTDLADGKWHHVAAVYPGADAGGANPQVAFYVDGVRELVESLHQKGGSIYHVPKTRAALPLMIGYVPQKDVERGFRGEIDEIYVFEAPLQEERIRELMRAGR
ncbi:MAG: LamG domain-containing protein [Luteolibacter sp.]|uniref:LamG domain-containing protein n=1 Tax=Luteolibacter sp. TaxID=1962973 RepID=UPI003263726F